MSRHKIVVISGALIVLGALVVSSNYQSGLKTAQAAKNSSQVQSIENATRDEQSKINAAVKTAVEKQCTADVAVYNKLPDQIRSKVPVPICIAQ